MEEKTLSNKSTFEYFNFNFNKNAAEQLTLGLE